MAYHVLDLMQSFLDASAAGKHLASPEHLRTPGRAAGGIDGGAVGSVRV